MATVSGNVYFDRDRSVSFNAHDTGLANIPVVLQNRTTNRRLAVLTNATGGFSFYNVPAGEYRLTEAYGVGGVPTPGDFANAAVGEIPTGANPPITAVPNPPAGSNHLDSLTPDTLFFTVGETDLTGKNFFDGPVIYTPIENFLDPCVSVTGDNLIRAADNGTFGSFPAGTSANTGAPAEPYPGVTPDFQYVLPNPAVYAPFGGEYTVQNIMTDSMSASNGAWWRIADHTAGNETGRMMVVNGDDPGAVFFRARVDVEPNRYYLFTAWILNLFKVKGYPDPKFGVRILDPDGALLFDDTLGALIPVNTGAPEWREVGSAVYSRDNTSLTLEFVSEGAEEVGNDYAIDDIAFREIALPDFRSVKSVDRPAVSLGESVTFTVTLENPCRQPLTSLFFRNILPDGFSFVSGSVRVDGNALPLANPISGFSLSDLLGEQSVAVSFEARAETLPNPNPAVNRASFNSFYTPVEGGALLETNVVSNPVTVEVTAGKADLAVVKTANPSPVSPGGLLTYVLTISNAGPSDADNFVLRDSLPAGLSGAEYSLDGGLTWNPWTRSHAFGLFAAGRSETVLLRGRVTVPSGSTLVNTATVESTTLDPNPDNNRSIIRTDVLSSSADLAVIKRAQPVSAAAGDRMTYTVVITNRGPDNAEDTLLYDALPPELTDTAYSLDGGITWKPYVNPLLLGELSAGESRSVLYRGSVTSSACGAISNTAVVTSSTPDANPDNNTSTVNVPVRRGADLSIRKVVAPRSVLHCRYLTYLITVTNAGPDTARQVTIADFLPPELSRPIFSTDDGRTWRPWSGRYTVSSLSPNMSVSILLAGLLPSGMPCDICNTASVSSSTPDPNPGNNADCVMVRSCRTLSRENEEENGPRLCAEVRREAEER